MHSNWSFTAYLGGLSLVMVILLMAVAGWTQDDDYMGNYTGADADLMGSDMCKACHAQVVPEEGSDTHYAVFDEDEENENYGYGCEACHGPGGNHMGDPAGILSFCEMPVDDATASCTACHDEVGAFSLESWEDGRHNGASISCTRCHSGHSDYESFLVEETDVALCSGCHTDIGEAFANEEHGVPGSGMTCANCHNPHD